MTMAFQGRNRSTVLRQTLTLTLRQTLIGQRCFSIRPTTSPMEPPSLEKTRDEIIKTPATVFGRDRIVELFKRWSKKHGKFFVFTSFSGIYLYFSSVTSTMTGLESHTSASEDPILKLFESWMEKYGKVYQDSDEKEKRFRVFKEKLAFVNEWNMNTESCYLGLNQFSDMTQEEFKKTYSNGLNMKL